MRRLFHQLKLRVRAAVKRRLLSASWKLINRYGASSHYFTNIGLDVTNSHQKTALISYITDSLRYDVMAQVGHTNALEQAAILKAFSDMGFCCDVVRFDDEWNLDIIKKKRYDLIFGFGAPYEIACKNNPDATKITYLTGAPLDFAYTAEQERFTYYNKRHGKAKGCGRVQESAIRSGDTQIKISDIGLFYRNQVAVEAYNKRYPNLKLELFAPTGLINDHYKKTLPPADPKMSRNGFVWFGSSGAILKGLDIILDVFRSIPDATLYICGLYQGDRWLLDSYRDCHNIIDCGFINVASDSYVNLVQKASWIIFPSASEGMATSVLTCMRHGLIPIVTDTTGIDVGDFGIRLNDFKVEYISSVIRNVLSFSDDEISVRRQKTYDIANGLYSIERYAKDFRQIIERNLK